MGPKRVEYAWKFVVDNETRPLGFEPRLPEGK